MPYGQAAWCACCPSVVPVINTYRLTRRIYLIGMAMLLSAGFLSAFTVSASSTLSGTSSIVAQICALYNTVHTIIFILGLALIIVGAALYAGGNIAPSQVKGAAQGYGIGMIMGGIVGVIIAIAAPYILGIISGTAASTITAQCP